MRDSYRTFDTLPTADGDVGIYSLPKLGAALGVDARPHAGVAEGAAGKPGAARGRRDGDSGRYRRPGALARSGRVGTRSVVSSRARSDAGFIRRAAADRSRRHARRHGGARPRSAAHRSGHPDGTGDRSFRARRFRRHARMRLRATCAWNWSGMRERYGVVRWAMEQFHNLRVVPPGNGIVHQVNIEHFAQVVVRATQDGSTVAFPDSLVGMDSHTPMVNALGVFGWGVGGIEAATAMFGQPVGLPTPRVVGCRLLGAPRARRDVHRYRACAHPFPARLRRAGGRGRVLRPGARPSVAARPRDDRQHGSGIRRHDGFLPGRCGDAALSAPDRAAAGADRPGGALHQGAGPVARSGTSVPDPVWNST